MEGDMASPVVSPEGHLAVLIPHSLEIEYLGGKPFPQNWLPRCYRRRLR